jgi:predicted RNA-binding Zn-ribbon protein involved in translation (DUF1610 family)
MTPDGKFFEVPSEVSRRPIDAIAEMNEEIDMLSACAMWLAEELDRMRAALKAKRDINVDVKQIKDGDVIVLRGDRRPSMDELEQLSDAMKAMNKRVVLVDLGDESGIEVIEIKIGEELVRAISECDDARRNTRRWEQAYSAFVDRINGPDHPDTSVLTSEYLQTVADGGLAALERALEIYPCPTCGRCMILDDSIVSSEAYYRCPICPPMAGTDKKE